MVNHLDTVETGHMRTPSTCLRPQARQGPENEALHPLDLWMASHKTTICEVSEIWCVISVLERSYAGLTR